MTKPWFYEMCQEGHVRAVVKEVRRIMSSARDSGLSEFQARAEARRIVVRDFGLGPDGWTEEGLARAFTRKRGR